MLKEKAMTRFITVFIPFILLFSSSFVYGQDASADTASTATDDSFTFIGVGDIMLGTNFPKSPNYLPPNNDCKPLMADVVDLLVDADVTFGNLEGAMTDSHANAKKCGDPKYCYAFAMPTSFGGCFKDAGFDLLSIANNHSGDFNYQGRKSTMNLLDSLNIGYAGLLIKPTAIIERDGKKIGFCAFAPNNGTCQLNNHKKAAELVRSLDTICDMVVVSFHGGAEGSKHQHVTKKTEMYLGMNRGNVYQFARVVIDAGADVVFGHGPHVTRAVDVYKGRFIAYSLGNFCTYKRFNISSQNGWAPIVKVWTDGKGEFQKAKIYATYQTKEGGTFKDPQKRVIARMKSLTETDLPETPIKITDDGDIILK